MMDVEPFHISLRDRIVYRLRGALSGRMWLFWLLLAYAAYAGASYALQLSFGTHLPLTPEQCQECMRAP